MNVYVKGVLNTNTSGWKYELETVFYDSIHNPASGGPIWTSTDWQSYTVLLPVCK